MLHVRGFVKNLSWMAILLEEQACKWGARFAEAPGDFFQSKRKSSSGSGKEDISQQNFNRSPQTLASKNLLRIIGLSHLWRRKGLDLGVARLGFIGLAPKIVDIAQTGQRDCHAKVVFAVEELINGNDA